MLRIAAYSSDGNEMLQSGFSIGSLGDYGIVENLDSEILDCAKKAKDLIDAPKVDGKETTVVLDQILAGVFVHEAFGHLSEADNVYENERLKEILTLGKKFGNKDLNITDGAKIPNLRGSYEFDDEGTPATKTPLIREGILTGRLHSNETANKMSEEATGNARAAETLAMFWIPDLGFSLQTWHGRERMLHLDTNMIQYFMILKIFLIFI